MKNDVPFNTDIKICLMSERKANCIGGHQIDKTTL